MAIVLTKIWFGAPYGLKLFKMLNKAIFLTRQIKMNDFPDFDIEVIQAEAGFPEPSAPEPEPATEKYNRALGLFSGISNDDYHDGPGISSSELKYCIKAMALYEAYQRGAVSFEETEAMRLGTAVHKMTLEAYDFGNEIVVSRKFGRKASEQIEKAEFQKENKGKTIITPDQYENCCRMTDSLLALPNMHDIFKAGHPEQSGYYIDKGGDETFMPGSERGTGMLCKYRPDWRHSNLLLDIKTTRDISAPAFSRTIHNLNYHVSAAHYLEGDRIIKGTNHNQFIFACVEPEPPYLACMYRLDTASLQLGKEQRRGALTGIKHGRETKEYPLYNNGICEEIGVPQYAHYESIKAKI